MPGTIIVGAQWGDEGKGKITDLLAARANLVVRYQGGDNAGHTVVYRGETFRLHHIPSGILYPHVDCVLGNGMVVNPRTLTEEMDALARRGIRLEGRLHISGKAHVVMPYHIALDRAAERMRGKGRIGTTGRGIGPAYTDKAARTGIRVEDLLDADLFAAKVEAALRMKNPLLQLVYGASPFEPEAIVEQYLPLAERLRPFVTDTSSLIGEALRSGKEVLFEGAQGTLLDLDHGTYPYVTSSSPCTGGALTGTGVGPGHISCVIGVSKAYTTRVGAGPFPTELKDETGELLRKRGHEYGTTTGRPRRCGWLDGVALRYAVMVSGITELAITKLDVLSGLARLRICVAYEHGGERMERFPSSVAVLARCRPLYEEFPGWKEDISEARTLDSLPREARDYLARIEELAGVPISYISVGPERDQTIRVTR